MASPQVENGYTMLSNELLDNFIKVTRFLSPYEIAVWLAILRKTYGYKKKEDWISRKQLEEI
ncbi:MAG: replication protein, partial [Candidatus Hydrothermia bacterium]